MAGVSSEGEAFDLDFRAPSLVEVDASDVVATSDPFCFDFSDRGRFGLMDLAGTSGADTGFDEVEGSETGDSPPKSVEPSLPNPSAGVASGVGCRGEVATWSSRTGPEFAPELASLEGEVVPTELPLAPFVVGDSSSVIPPSILP